MKKLLPFLLGFLCSVACAQIYHVFPPPSTANASIYADGIATVKGDGVTDDTAALQALINQLNAGGGGYLFLAAKTYYVPGGLAAKQNVHIKGIAFGITYTPAGNSYSFTNGTILKGNNTNPGIYFNPSDLSAPPTFTAFTTGGLYGFSVEDVGFLNNTYGMKFGGKFQPSLFQNTYVRNVAAIGSSVWGFQCNNCTLTHWQDVAVYNYTAAATGAIRISGDVPTSTYNPGNSIYENLLTYPGNATGNQRGIVIEGLGGGNLNDIHVISVTSNNNSGSGSPLSTAATMSSGATAFPITASTQVNFPVDSIVTVSSSVNGFVSNQGYFVDPFSFTTSLLAGATSAVIGLNGVSTPWAGPTNTYTLHFSDGTTRSATLTNGSAAVSWSGGLPANVNKIFTVTDVIQLSNTKRGVPLQAFGNAAINIQNYGMSNLEIMGWDYPYDPDNNVGASSIIQAIDISGIDTEGQATALVSVQHAFARMGINYQSGGQGSYLASTVMLRANQGTISKQMGQGAFYLDVDLPSSYTTQVLSGVLNSSGTPVIQLYPQGIFYGPLNPVLSLGGGNPKATFQVVTPNNIAITYTPTPIDQTVRHITFQWSGFTLDSNWAGSIIYACGAGAGCTGGTDNAVLPTLDGTDGGTATNSYAGLPFCIVNSSVDSLQLSTSSGQLFNRQSGFTALSLNTGDSICYRAQFDGSVSFWAIESWNSQGYTYNVPVNNFSLTVGNQIKRLVLEPAGVLATGTITMPPGPVDGDEVGLSSTQTITALTVQGNAGQTIADTITTLGAGGAATFKWIKAQSKWYRVAN